MKLLIQWFRKVRSAIVGKPFFNVDNEHPIIPAFISGGVQYYRFDDIFNAPFNRSFEAQTFYTEMQMRVDREYLKQHVEAMKSIMADNNGINISDTKSLPSITNEYHMVKDKQDSFFFFSFLISFTTP